MSQVLILRVLRQHLAKKQFIHKVKTCQWHFKHQAREKAKLTEYFEEEVLKLCDEMCLATTVDEYERKLNRLLKIGDMYPAFSPICSLVGC